MTNLEVHPIGTIYNSGEEAYIQLEKEFIPALRALEGFGCLNILWWFSDFDTQEYRSALEVEQPYKHSPALMGIFATRSPLRPNPIALTASPVINIDYETGVIRLAFIDANNGTPVLDIKPYTPSFDRMENPQVPDWCSHWPKSWEESASFPWENEFNF